MKHNVGAINQSINQSCCNNPVFAATRAGKCGRGVKGEGGLVIIDLILRVMELCIILDVSSLLHNNDDGYDDDDNESLQQGLNSNAELAAAAAAIAQLAYRKKIMMG